MKPQDAHLFGAKGCILRKPKCPDGGEYDLNNIKETRTCSITGHILE